MSEASTAQGSFHAKIEVLDEGLSSAANAGGPVETRVSGISPEMLSKIPRRVSDPAGKPGDMVKKSQSLGKSGSTGLAGGEQLQFSMQVDGVQVNPSEWWDEHWIESGNRPSRATGARSGAWPLRTTADSSAINATTA